MRFDETRDNTTDIENQIIEADEIGEAETEYDIEYDSVEGFDLSEIPEDGVKSVDLFDGKGRRLFSITVSTNGVAYQVLQAGEDAGLFTTTADEV